MCCNSCCNTKKIQKNSAFDLAKIKKKKKIKIVSQNFNKKIKRQP